MKKYTILLLLFICLLTIRCENNNLKQNDTTSDSVPAKSTTKQVDSTTVKSTDHTIDSVHENKDTLSILNNSNSKTEDFIVHYPGKQKTELRNQIEWLRKEWQNVSNPITAIYKGNDFGDYQHITFQDAKGKTYDFGQANNNFGEYQLYDLSGQNEDNPKFLGKQFKVYWDWRLSEFNCCDGEYGNAKAYLPSITKLELIKK